MGYTHYWTFRPAPRGQAAQTETAYQLALRQCQRLIRSYNAELKSVNPKDPGRLSGYSVHTKVYTYGGLTFNGTKELSHEDFSLREHYSQNESFNFCKTARKPYDICVVACCIILKHYLGALVDLSSDGSSVDLESGRELVSKVLRLNLEREAA